MSSGLFPFDWYWLRSDGQVFSSAREAIVGSTDEAYKDWTAGGLVATPWPRDDAGAETDAELRGVLRPYGIWQQAKAEPLITFKADVIRRATDDEVDALEAALAAASSKLRRLYLDIAHIDHNAVEFPVLHDAIQDALEQIMPAAQAAVRTTTLLMPSETEA